MPGKLCKISRHTSWKYHLAALAKKLARTSGIFLKIRHLIFFDTIILLYCAIFPLFLCYGIVVWGVVSECFINPVLVQQKRLSEQLLLMTPSHHQNFFSLS